MGEQMQVYHNEFMTVEGCDTIGPEMGIGHALEKAASPQQPKILLLKSCIGNRSLGWDLLPPGSESYDYKDQTYAGYGQSPAAWPRGTDPPPQPPNAWYAGKEYDVDIANAKAVLADLDTYYPGATNGYRIAGFFWWQGDKDRYTEAHAVRYEQNLVRLIRQLQTDFDAPHAKFVLATLGQDVVDDPGPVTNDTRLLQAMMHVSDPTRHPALQGQVATLYTHPLVRGGGASNSHYNGNAETYMNVGQAMGAAMVELLTINNDTTRNEKQRKTKKGP